MKDKIIEFKEGIPGFEDYKKYVLVLNEDEENPFHNLVSTEEEGLSFLVISPFDIVSDYDIEISDSAIESLNISSESDISILSIVKVPEDIRKMTVNLAAPLVINAREKLGKQVVLNNTDYSIRHRIAGEEGC